jgi:hypothetical protein
MLEKLYKTFLLTSITVFLVFVSPVSGTKQNEPNLREKMTFEIRWGLVSAGQATLEYFTEEEFNGAPVNHYLYTAKTSKFVDLFYKVRDRIDSYTDPDLTYSIFYNKIHRGKSKKDVIVTFDRDKNSVQCSINGNSINPLPMPSNAFDPLSIFYVFRNKLSDKKDNLEVRITDGKSCITAQAKIVKRESIKVDGQRYDTILVVPEIEGVRGVFKKSKNAKLKIWVTDDHRRIPVRIKSKVAVGSFVADLVEYKGTYNVQLN